MIAALRENWPQYAPLIDAMTAEGASVREIMQAIEERLLGQEHRHAC